MMHEDTSFEDLNMFIRGPPAFLEGPEIFRAFCRVSQFPLYLETGEDLSHKNPRPFCFSFSYKIL